MEANKEWVWVSLGEPSLTKSSLDRVVLNVMPPSKEVSEDLSKLDFVDVTIHFDLNHSINYDILPPLVSLVD